MTRIDEEKSMVSKMISLYCKKKEGNKSLCPECKELNDYALARLSHCTFGNDKPTCRVCHIHCYKPAMKEKMKKVMRFSGPRMIFYNPKALLFHFIREHKRKFNKQK